MPKRKPQTAEEVLSAIAALSPEEVRRLCGMMMMAGHTLLGEFVILPTTTAEVLASTYEEAAEMVSQLLSGDAPADGAAPEMAFGRLEDLGPLAAMTGRLKDALAKRTRCVEARTVVAKRNSLIANLISQGITDPGEIRGHLIEQHPELMGGRSKDGSKEYIRADMMMRAYNRRPSAADKLQ
jgi:hypothetical protein